MTKSFQGNFCDQINDLFDGFKSMIASDYFPANPIWMFLLK
jgi:hypothetical protein